ncbi:MAG: hypothetical protein Q8R58_08360 [Sulfuricurvum sp.]|nr:hypothetical protein [Sulfuricurvum sp.]
MQSFIVGVIIIAIIAYIIFVSRRKKLYKAIEEITSEKSESIVIKQSFEQITRTIQSLFKKIILTGETILFEYNSNLFIVVPISKKEVLISLAPSDDEVEHFIKLEDEIITSKNIQINESDFIAKIQHIIEKLNKAKLDYLDINYVYSNSLMGDTVLTFEMDNEENFSLIFESTEDMQIALDLINYKINIIPTNENEEYFKSLGLDELLINLKKMLFEDFINQYELNRDQMEAIYSWKENNDEKSRDKKIKNFNGYSLSFMNIGGDLSAILIEENEEEIDGIQH